MKQFIGAVATALDFWKLKAEGLRLKAVGQLSQKQLTNRLPQPASHNPDASGFAMTGEGGAVLVNGSALLYDSAPKSNNHSLTVDSALFYAVVMQQIKHWLRSRKRSGEFFWLLFLRKKKLLAFPPAMRREDLNSKDSFQIGDNRRPSQQQFTRGLPQPASHNPAASGFAMTGEGGAVLVNGSFSVNSSICKSNDRLLPENSALFYAEVMQKIKHWLCSRKRSGEFFWLLFLRKKKLLAFPPAMRREDYGLQNISDSSRNLFIERENGSCALGFPSLIGGTRPSPFLLKRTKKLWLQNLWLKQLRIGAQTEPLRYAALLQFASSPFRNCFFIRFNCFLKAFKHAAQVLTPNLLRPFLRGGSAGVLYRIETFGSNEILFINKISKSNNHSLPENSALAVAVEKQKFLHFHCSNWRSGEFFWLLFLRKKKLLAFPPAMRREDYGLQYYFKKRFNSELSQKQSTQGLSQPALLNADASGFAMTGEGGAVLVNGSGSVNSSVSKSNDRLLTWNSALAVAVEKQKFLHFHCSNWRSGGFFWLLFSAAGKKLLALRGNKRVDYGLLDYFKKRFNSESSQKKLTRGLSQPALLNADASGFTMTGEGGAVLVNRSISVNSSVSKSNDHSLTVDSALFYAVVMQDLKHWLCSRKRSGEFIQFIYCFFKAFMCSLRSGLATFCGKKWLALPPAMRREDYGLQKISDSSRNLFIERENGSCALGLPSLIGGTRPSPFCLDTKGTKKSRLSNLWLKQSRIGAQTEPLHYAALLQFASSPFRNCFFIRFNCFLKAFKHAAQVLTPNLLRPSLHCGSAGVLYGSETFGSNKILLINKISKSNDRLLTWNSALAVAVEKQKFLHFHCSNWRSGGFFWLLFSAAGKKLLALPPAMRREDYGLQYYFKKRFNSELSQKQSTQGLSQPAVLKSAASGFTMTGEGEAVPVNGSISVNNYAKIKNNAVTKFLKKLWKGYLEKQNHRKEVQRRLLRQRAIKREREIETGKWTDRFLKSGKFRVESSKYKVESSKLKVESGKLKVESGKFRVVESGSFSIALLFLMVVSFGGYGQERALNIGDELPQSAIGVKNQAYLMLFISSGCKNFRAVLRDLDSLGKGAKLPVIAITTEKAEEMDPKVRDAYDGKIGVRWRMGDGYWNSLFPHRIAPHLVWVDGKGKVAAISYAEQVSLEQLKSFQRGKIPNIPSKVDVLDFDPKQSMMVERYPEAQSFYGLVKKYLPGIESVFGVERDSIKGTVRTYIINFPLYKIYLMAFNRAFTYIPNRLVWEVKDKGDYLPEISNMEKREWYSRNAYCYESILPIDTPDSMRMQKIQADLNLSLGMNSRLEYRKVKTWVLEKTGEIQPAIPQKSINTLEGTSIIKEIRNAKMSSFTSYYNWKADHIPVVDETGYLGKIDLRLEVEDMEDLKAVNHALAPYHLRLTEQERELEFIVYTKNK